MAALLRQSACLDDDEDDTAVPQADAKVAATSSARRGARSKGTKKRKAARSKATAGGSSSPARQRLRNTGTGPADAAGVGSSLSPLVIAADISRRSQDSLALSDEAKSRDALGARERGSPVRPVGEKPPSLFPIGPVPSSQMGSGSAARMRVENSQQLFAINTDNSRHGDMPLDQLGASAARDDSEIIQTQKSLDGDAVANMFTDPNSIAAPAPSTTSARATPRTSNPSDAKTDSKAATSAVRAGGAGGDWNRSRDILILSMGRKHGRDASKWPREVDSVRHILEHTTPSQIRDRLRFLSRRHKNWKKSGKSGGSAGRATATRRGVPRVRRINLGVRFGRQEPRQS